MERIGGSIWEMPVLEIFLEIAAVSWEGNLCATVFTHSYVPGVGRPFPRSGQHGVSGAIKGDMTMAKENPSLRSGAILMVVGVLFFLIYGIVFLLRSFTGTGFEIGVETLNGITLEDVNNLDPAVGYYMAHIQVALAGFIISTSIAVGALAWFGVRGGQWWAWLTAMVAPVVALVIALPMHYTGGFPHDWVTHIGPIYLGTLIFVVGGLIGLKGLMAR